MLSNFDHCKASSAGVFMSLKLCALHIIRLDTSPRFSGSFPLPRGGADNALQHQIPRMSPFTATMNGSFGLPHSCHSLCRRALQSQELRFGWGHNYHITPANLYTQKPKKMSILSVYYHPSQLLCLHYNKNPYIVNPKATSIGIHMHVQCHAG